MTERPMGIPKLSCLLSVSVDSVCGKWPQYLPPAPGVCDLKTAPLQNLRFYTL